MKIPPLIAAFGSAVCLLVAPACPLVAQNPFTALEGAAIEKLAEQAIESLLNNQLPLTLNADKPSLRRVLSQGWETTAANQTTRSLN